MPTFFVKAIAPSGEKVETLREAPSEKALLQQLRQEGWLPIRIEPARSGWLASFRHRRSLRPKELGLWTRELATLLQAGLPLDRALRTLRELLPRSSLLRALTERFLERVRQGSQLSAAIEAEGELFPGFYTALVRAGEVSGTLPQVLDRLATDLERLQALRSQVVSAMIYPAILVVLAILSLLALLTFVIPRFEEMFAAAGRELPLPTQAVFGTARFVRDFWWLLLATPPLLLLLFQRWLKVSRNRLRFDTWLLELPVLGVLLVQFNVARFSRTLATLLQAGLPLYQALLIVRETLGNLALQEAVGRAAEQLREGGEMARALKASGHFPTLALQMIALGEESGHLPETLSRLARLSEEEVETQLKRLLTLLEPVLILGMGLLIGGIIFSVMVAVVSLNDLAF